MLNREPMGMKHGEYRRGRSDSHVSVLNREPMGMKPMWPIASTLVSNCFSAQPRADGDEAVTRGVT